MIMRKFHNSIAVGFFMGVTVTSCQFYLGLALIYFHYRHYNIQNSSNGSNNAKDVTLFAYLSIIQAILLGSFAIILAAHRTEISFDSTTGSEENHLPSMKNEHHQQQQHQQPSQLPIENNSANSETLYQAPPQSSRYVRDQLQEKRLALYQSRHHVDHEIVRGSTRRGVPCWCAPRGLARPGASAARGGVAAACIGDGDFRDGRRHAPDASFL